MQWITSISIFSWTRLAIRYDGNCTQKTTVQTCYLHSSSGHARNIMKSWPIAEIQRRHKRCSLHADFIKAKQEFIKELNNAFYDERVVAKMQNTNPGLSRKRTQQERTPRIYWVIPYHPAIERINQQRVIRDYTRMWGVTEFTVSIAWKNTLPNLAGRIRKAVFCGGFE